MFVSAFRVGILEPDPDLGVVCLILPRILSVRPETL